MNRFFIQRQLNQNFGRTIHERRGGVGLGVSRLKSRGAVGEAPLPLLTGNELTIVVACDINKYLVSRLIDNN